MGVGPLTGAGANVRSSVACLTGADHPCLTTWGHQITIEQSTTPAGWYTDPAGSGSKRWWDGVQWTSHLQAPTPPPPPAISYQAAPGYPTAPGAAAGLAPVAGTALAMHQPQPIEPQRVDPYAQANPYGLPAVQERPYVPLQRGGPVSPSYYSPAQQGPGPAIGFVILGSVALALALVGFIPGAPVFYYAGGGIFGVIGGIRTLVRSRGAGSPIASIAAIVLGSLAIVFMIISIAVHATAYASPSFTDNGSSQTSSGTASGTGAQSGSSSGVVPTPPTFAADANLTAYEKTAAAVALSVDQFANGGMAYSPNPSWPAALTLGPGNAVLLPSGTSSATLPDGQALKYELSGDKQNFAVFVSGGNDKEIAIYDSSTNSFTWVCDTGAPASCPAGGLPPASSSTGTSNS